MWGYIIRSEGAWPIPLYCNVTKVGWGSDTAVVGPAIYIRLLFEMGGTVSKEKKHILSTLIFFMITKKIPQVFQSILRITRNLIIQNHPESDIYIRYIIRFRIIMFGESASSQKYPLLGEIYLQWKLHSVKDNRRNYLDPNIVQKLLVWEYKIHMKVTHIHSFQYATQKKFHIFSFFKTIYSLFPCSHQAEKINDFDFYLVVFFYRLFVFIQKFFSAAIWWYVSVKNFFCRSLDY